MSVFSNPSDGAAGHAEAYLEAVLGLVEGKDALDVLRTTPSFVAGVLAGVTSSQHQIPERPGKWSLAGVVLHLADSELVWGWRLRRILSEDRPQIDGYDQDRWAGALGYDRVDVEGALDLFRALRRSNLRLLKGAGPDDLRRVGVHVERGEESVEHMIPLYAGHDLAHRNQLLRIADTLEGAGE